nr:phage holin family protein [Propionibacterium sp.]
MIGSFVLRFLATVVALVVATLLLPGVTLGSSEVPVEIVTMVVVAAIFGAVNGAVKPLFRFRHTPGYLILLGAALLVANAALLLLTSWVCSLLRVPWHVDGFASALVGGIIVSVVSFLANALLGSRAVVHR